MGYRMGKTRYSVVKEKSPRATGFALAVDFEVDILENTGLRWRRAFLGKVCGRGGLSFRLRVDGLELFFAQELFSNEPILKEPDRIVLVLYFPISSSLR